MVPNTPSNRHPFAPLVDRLVAELGSRHQDNTPAAVVAGVVMTRGQVNAVLGVYQLTTQEAEEWDHRLHGF